MLFELTTPQPATLTSITPRNEMHGDEEVLAVSLGFKITAANTLLDRISPTLRGALYMAEPNQLSVPTVDAGTPKLRTEAIRSVSLALTLEGWTLSVLRRVDNRVGVILAACKVDAFRLEPIEGGSIALSFRVGTSKVDGDIIGDLCSQLGHEIAITLVAPLIKEGDKAPADEDIAARKTLPKAKRQRTLDGVEPPPMTATEIFAAQHGAAAKKRPALKGARAQR